MYNKENTPTHKAYTLQQSAKPASRRWLEIGSARLDDNGGAHVKLDVLPIGGFTGYIYLSPTGKAPPTIEPIVRRPASSDDEPDET